VSFHPTSPPIPTTLHTPLFTIRPLTDVYAAQDYEAYRASPTVIALHSAGRWQVEGFTLAQNVALARQHATDHAAQRNFAFILLTPDEQKSLGCFYINPLQPFLARVAPALPRTPAMSADASVTFWLREDEQAGTLPDNAVQTIETWLREAWHFNGHLWRVRDVETRSILALRRAALTERFTLDVEGIGQYRFFG
jgi:hypothetical protein